jgi:DNA-binding winged helix-turn-helix (wHTH) protein/Tol biopolymer transport system component
MSRAGQQFEFSDFILDTREKLLLQKGEPVPLTPKAFELLSVLVSNHGHLVKKDELIAHVWPDSIVEEANLPFTIGLLRKALGDSAQNPKFIETVPKRGYRFIADVREITSTIRLREAPLDQPRTPYVLIAIACMLILSLFGFAFVWFRGQRPAAAEQTSNPLTNSKKITIATVAPDGRTIVYAQKEGVGESLWRQDSETGEQIRILDPVSAEFVGLAISPDLDVVYYSVFASNSAASAMSRIPLNGGTPEPMPAIASDVSVTFSPDGKRFAYTEGHSAVSETELKIADADGSNSKLILTLKGEKRAFPVFRASPIAWSPDGSEIACAVREFEDGDSFSRIVFVDASDGSEKHVSQRRWGYVDNIAWLDASTLAITVIETDAPGKRAWLVSRTSDDARVLNKGMTEYEWLSAARGKLFAVERVRYSSVYITDFAEGFQSPQTKQILNEAGVIDTIDWAGNDKIYFNSWTTGNNEIWRVSPDGTGTEKLTNDSKLSDGFSVSPTDGSIVFSGAPTRSDNLFLADADGRNIRRLTEGGDDFLPRFMPDGEEVIFQRRSVPKSTLWRVSTKSDEPPRQLTGYTAQHPSVSPDGKMIAYQFMT